MLAQNDLDWFAARLAIAVYDINAEHRAMSIQTFREALKHLPGAQDITMRYGNGGATQIFEFDGEAFELGPNASPADLESAYQRSKKKL